MRADHPVEVDSFYLGTHEDHRTGVRRVLRFERYADSLRAFRERDDAVIYVSWYDAREVLQLAERCHGL